MYLFPIIFWLLFLRKNTHKAFSTESHKMAAKPIVWTSSTEIECPELKLFCPFFLLNLPTFTYEILHSIEDVLLRCFRCVIKTLPILDLWSYWSNWSLIDWNNGPLMKWFIHQVAYTLQCSDFVCFFSICIQSRAKSQNAVLCDILVSSPENSLWALSTDKMIWSKIFINVELLKWWNTV